MRLACSGGATKCPSSYIEVCVLPKSPPIYPFCGSFPVACNQLSQITGGCGPFQRPLPHAFRSTVVQRQSLGRRSDHRDTDSHIGFLTEPEGTQRQQLAVRLTEYLKTGMGEGFGHEP